MDDYENAAVRRLRWGGHSNYGWDDDVHELEPTSSFDDVEVMHTTDDAILVAIEGEEFWIPHEHVRAESEVTAKGDTGELVIPRWLARKKGLI